MKAGKMIIMTKNAVAVLLLISGVRAIAQDATVLETAKALVQDSRIAERALITTRGELWKQVREAERSSRDIQYTRYQCISKLEPQALAMSFVEALATKVEPTTLRELAQFYSRREIKAVSDRSLATIRKKNSLPEPVTFVQTEPTYNDLVGTGNAAFAAMKDSSAQRSFDEIVQTTYSGTVRNVLVDFQQQCMRSNELVLPKVKDARTLPYPVIAKRFGIEGMLEAMVQVDATGKPMRASVVRRWFNSSDFTTQAGQKISVAELFDPVVIEHLMSSNFEPALKDGLPVPSTYRAPFNFVLE
jgi:hypothetical protein